MDRVYEAAWARIEAQEPYIERDAEREEKLRKTTFLRWPWSRGLRQPLRKRAGDYPSRLDGPLLKQQL